MRYCLDLHPILLMVRLWQAPLWGAAAVNARRFFRIEPAAAVGRRTNTYNDVKCTNRLSHLRLKRISVSFVRVAILLSSRFVVITEQ
jgi:hypothetical protein